MFAGWFGASQPGLQTPPVAPGQLNSDSSLKKRSLHHKVRPFPLASKPSGVDHQFKAELALEKSSRT